MPKQLKFWNLVKNEEEKTAELILYGSIGSDEYWDDVSDKVFKQDIENLGDVENITLYINSPGGSVFSAVAIANTLKNHKAKVTANIDGLAASAATIITSACDTVRMPKNALFMIHNPITFAYGNNQEMQKTVEMLDKVKNSIIETYLNKTKTDKETLSELMDNETWMDAEMAKDYGFVDEIVDEEVGKEFVENKLIINNMAFDISKFKNFRKVKGVVINNKKNTKEVKMTLDELKNQFPDLYDYVLNEGKKIGKEEERERIKAIDDIGVNNYSDLIENAKYVNPMSASELAINILKKQKEEKAQKLQNIKNESQGNFIPPAANDGTTHGKKEEKQFMGLDIMTIFSKMNKKTEEGK
ncbi:ATP-dependent Clp protease proteolytic subunit [Leptotrichia hofstadii]|jgi:ATP-dependent Clp protease, proteolytic subunit ClpP|uniref:ATP-dependent Clp protease proteolytic subunit n=1 Tax=Leptotrichia hofstadii TaxID=157688 RepID=A0A510JEM1_9FUSO|nr:head maturation protease, ClpP-related [Leptotrichia hofstadii]BBM37694.1 ATP-dependent Clp protease proteolytic subunit [Leptotrichia hofstadii]